MRQISDKDTMLSKLGLLIISPIAVGVTFIFTFWLIQDTSGGVIALSIMFQLLITFMMAVVFEYALRLKNVFVNEKYILISGLIKKEKVSLSNIKKFKYHPLLYRMVRRPFVIEFEKETSFGKKIYFFPTIAAKSGSINFLEVFDIKEELEKKIEEIKQSR